ncbi:winged helix-turn-helix transcriptional regulator [Streptosporangium sp. NPDC001559]|uniref:winged helix-turn-helix transcriptional regulator n=1 Tax=Streptosporangium sp. NPDC001559 TaxID=3366187 RepID=UPI0036E65551
MSEPLDPDMFAGCRNVVPPMRMHNKWALKIMVCLEPGRRRFSELQVPLRGITPKVLTESLRAMERDGFVTRTAYPGVPPRVEYELTDLGRSLLGPMYAWCRWSEEHLTELEAAREAYDAAV